MGWKGMRIKCLQVTTRDEIHKTRSLARQHRVDDGSWRPVGANKKELRGSTQRGREQGKHAWGGRTKISGKPQHIAAANSCPHTRASPTKCLVPVNRGKISRRGDIIAVIESQHGTDPCVLQTLPNDPAWMRNYLRNGFSETSSSPSGNWIGRSDRRVTLRAAIPDALARLCLALSEQNVTFSLTPLPPSVPFCPWGATSPPSRPFQSLVQLDPPVCTAIAKIGEHAPLRMGAIFAKFYSWERGGEFTNWLLYWRIILLYEISK